MHKQSKDGRFKVQKVADSTHITTDIITVQFKHLFASYEISEKAILRTDFTKISSLLTYN